uniref:uncharacterized protein LOC104266618 n=1 Tax=Ciona intestinalis TaxID=7719 RepID=UPI0005218A4A|nr:uncharacterized protein LOC104266618 [Ciona intestinalis]|eukprot:XP_009861594.1 uncharacterized protein LOC104266618 [Ciona intestinalis]
MFRHAVVVVFILVINIVGGQKKHLNKFCPFTLEQCNDEPYNKLKSCKLALNKPDKLKEISDKYLCSTRDKLNQIPETITKRSIERSNNRTRRSALCNICTRSSNQQIIYGALDAQFGTNAFLELVHNPADNLYQTLTIQSCDTTLEASAGGRVHTCTKQMLEFTAAVWVGGYEAVVQLVKYPTSCAFQYKCV